MGNAEILEQLRVRWLQINPSTAHTLGIHENDGKLEDYSPEGIETRISWLKQAVSTIKRINPQNKEEEFNVDLMLSSFKTDLWELEIHQEYLDSPTFYSYALMRPEGSFTIRNFASHDDRVRIIIDYSRSLEKWFDDAKKNLTGPLPLAKIQMGLNISQGSRPFFADQLIEFVAKSENEKLIEEWSEVNIRLLEIIDDWVEFLKLKLETGHENFALGEEKWLEYLRMTEGIPESVSAQQLLSIGEKNLDDNYNQFVEIAERKGYKDAFALKDFIYSELLPTPETLIPKTAEFVDRSRQFLIDSSIVTLPSEDKPDVVVTPKAFRKFAFAAMNTPGPFDPPEAKEALYYVTPPEPEWSSERTQEFLSMFAHPVNEIIAVHEAFPGHYLQLLWSNKATNKIALTFAYSYAMIEGWGHYTEQMVLEEGYPHEDPDILKAGQLIEALIRNVRYVCAIRMHVYGMSVEEATKLFMEKAFMPEQNASIEANRGTVDPLYLNYTLGKLMIYKLREDYKNELGETYSLRKFHDTILSFGSPNIAVLRRVMLKNNHEEVL